MKGKKVKLTLAAGLMAVSNLALAALPTVAPPTTAAAAGNFIALLQNYSKDVAVFGGLLLAVVVFFVVAKNTLVSYSEVANNRSTWGQVGLQAGVGVGLLLFIVFLLTEAAKIL